MVVCVMVLASRTRWIIWEIIVDAKGSTKAKQFVVQLIPRFFKYFLSFPMQAMNVQLDLCEEDELGVGSITSMG
jgi:hypothetical protein